MSSQNIIEPRLLKGFRDMLPGTMLARQHMIRTIQGVLETFGFLPLETPTLEYADILLGKLGDEGEKLLYKFRDHGDREVAMRYDFTVPLARVMAQNQDLPKPFKRYQVGPVWRADNTQRGRYREFYQFDMDIVGTKSTLADAEILVLMQNIMLALGVKEFVIRVNDRQWLDQQLSSLQLEETQQKSVYLGLDKWDKIGQPAVAEGWAKDGIKAEVIERLLELASSDKTAADQPLTHTLTQAQNLGLKKDHVRFDPTIVRGLDYYSGIVFETQLTNAQEYGSVLSGGRYDGLVGRFSKNEVPAVGTSVGVDRLFAALLELGLLKEESTTTNVYVTIFSEDLMKSSLDLASELRQNGINTQTAYEAGNIGKQLKFAANVGIPKAIIIGPDEATADQVVLRDLLAGNEKKVSRTELIRELKA